MLSTALEAGRWVRLRRSRARIAGDGLSPSPTTTSRIPARRAWPSLAASSPPRAGRPQVLLARQPLASVRASLGQIRGTMRRRFRVGDVSRQSRTQTGPRPATRRGRAVAGESSARAGRRSSHRRTGELARLLLPAAREYRLRVFVESQSGSCCPPGARSSTRRGSRSRRERSRDGAVLVARHRGDVGDERDRDTRGSASRSRLHSVSSIGSGGCRVSPAASRS